MQHYNLTLSFDARCSGGDLGMALTDEEMMYYIQWQSMQNPEYTFVPPIINKEMSEEQIHKIVGAYIVFTVLSWCALIGIALVVGLVMWACGAL